MQLTKGSVIYAQTYFKVIPLCQILGEIHPKCIYLFYFYKDLQIETYQNKKTHFFFFFIFQFDKKNQQRAGGEEKMLSRLKKKKQK